MMTWTDRNRLILNAVARSKQSDEIEARNRTALRKGFLSVVPLHLHRSALAHIKLVETTQVLVPTMLRSECCSKFMYSGGRDEADAWLRDIRCYRFRRLKKKRGS